MRRRHAALLGAGLGGLAVLALVVLAGSGVITTGGRPAANASAAPSPSASAPPTSSASPSPAELPAGRIGAVLVYDPENSGLLLFGGVTAVHNPDGTNSAITLGDTWLWNGSGWRRLDVQGPPARGGAMAAYDPIRHVIVLFGGSGPEGAGKGLYLGDTWTWDGSSWQQQHPRHSPNPRMRAGMAFDQARGDAVMFGGEGDTVYTATWTWDGADWTLRDPAASPSPRTFPAMAYSQASQTTVLYGGHWAGHDLSDTWQWDGATWKQTADAPVAGWASMTYDEATHEIVAYVYTRADPHLLTWTGAWIDQTPNVAPPSSRAQTAFAYDGADYKVVMFGGQYADPIPYRETWIYYLSTWTLWQGEEAA